jgi:hypothetical protein
MTFWRDRYERGFERLLRSLPPDTQSEVMKKIRKEHMPTITEWDAFRHSMPGPLYWLLHSRAELREMDKKLRELMSDANRL